MAEVERELNEAQHRVESAKAVYEVIVRRMSEELARFQRERAAELAGVLRNFAMAQAQLAGDTAKVGGQPCMLHQGACYHREGPWQGALYKGLQQLVSVPRGL